MVEEERDSSHKIRPTADSWRLLALSDIHLKNFKPGLPFWQDVVSIRNLRHRYLFLFYTLAIWLSYTAVFWFSFFLMDLHEAYSLGISDALVVMVFSAAGFAIPTPGGTGSFHYLVQQSLWIVCGVAAEPALTYALITHAAITAAVLIFGGAALLFDRIISRRTSV